MDDRTLRTDYLTHIASEPHAPPLFSDLIKDSDDRRINTDWLDVFIPMQTSTPDKSRVGHDDLRPVRENPPVSVHTAITHESLLLLCGSHGAGKSSVLHAYTCLIAGECLRMSDLSPVHTTPGQGAPATGEEGDFLRPQPLLPIYLNMSQHGDRPGSGISAAKLDILSYCEDHMRQAGLLAFFPEFCNELEGTGIHFFIDDLDALASGDDGVDSPLMTEILEFTRSYPRARIVASVHGPKSAMDRQQANGFPVYELAPLSVSQIHLLIQRWFGYFMQDHSGEISRGRDAIESWLEDDTNRYDLVRNPLMLTLLLYIHTLNGPFEPKSREDLLAKSVEALSDRWFEVGLGKTLDALLSDSQVVDWPKVDRAQFLLRLEHRLYVQVRDASSNLMLSGFSPDEILGAFLSPHRQPHPAGSFLAREPRIHGGIFSRGRAEVCTPPHVLIQDFLVSDYLSDAGFPEQVIGLFLSNPRRWQEIMLTCAQIAADKNPTLAEQLIDRLCASDSRVAANPWVWYSAARILTNVRMAKGQVRKEIVAQIQENLTRIIEQGDLAIEARVSAGNMLAELGDLRFRSDAWHLPKDPLLGFIEVPEGAFVMGSKEDEIASLIDEYGVGPDWEGQTLGAMLSKERNIDELIREMGLADGWEKLDSIRLMFQWYKREVPQHVVDLPRFFIARYPVTNAQFKAFLEDTGYQPEVGEAYEGVSNHPLAHVTWQDSMRYCRWLTRILRSWTGTPQLLLTLLKHEWQVTLPSEAEWEKAARGPAGRVGQARLYPWGDAFDPDCANLKETGLGGTTTVGCFPKGASPYGVLDLAGNVWEWTRSLWGEDEYIVRYPYPYRPLDGREAKVEGALNQLRVLRGASYANYRRYARCATRRSPLPVLRSSVRGFRLALSPSGFEI
jgi:formylglycine-generating enzyme required for sulfatase activity